MIRIIVIESSVRFLVVALRCAGFMVSQRATCLLPSRCPLLPGQGCHTWESWNHRAAGGFRSFRLGVENFMSENFRRGWENLRRKLLVEKAQSLGIPGNLTELFQQVYFSILGPTLQARLVTWPDASILIHKSSEKLSLSWEFCCAPGPLGSWHRCGRSTSSFAVGFLGDAFQRFGSSATLSVCSGWCRGRRDFLTFVRGHDRCLRRRD